MFSISQAAKLEKNHRKWLDFGAIYDVFNFSSCEIAQLWEKSIISPISFQNFSIKIKLTTLFLRILLKMLMATKSAKKEQNP